MPKQVDQDAWVTVPLRVPITKPSNGVKPIEVSLRRYHRALRTPMLRSQDEQL